MIKIELLNAQEEKITGKIDHEKEIGFLEATGVEQAVLGIKNFSYSFGDKIRVTTEKKETYFVVQLEETLALTLLYLPSTTWEYVVPLSENLAKSAVDTAFHSRRHCIMVRKAHAFEVENYQNLSFNSHDQKETTGAFPHVYANVETREDSVFFAKNAIDGKYANLSHGSYPFASWGINQQSDAALTIDFGREVEIDCLRLLFRGDYPHDSFWTQVSVHFSNGETEIFKTTNSLEFQFFSFKPKRVTSITLTDLKKNKDDSPFPALVQIEVFGKNVKV
ncbi:MAG: discoidin domain-containing protein [Lactobacillales bacterium]|jgi:hypothetical protein|nr:discoidin domain-containing protein [Lactobacillales bacterium]